MFSFFLVIVPFPQKHGPFRKKHGPVPKKHGPVPKKHEKSNAIFTTFHTVKTFRLVFVYCYIVESIHTSTIPHIESRNTDRLLNENCPFCLHMGSHPKNLILAC